MATASDALNWAGIIAPLAGALTGSGQKTPAQTLGSLPPNLLALLNNNAQQQMNLNPLKASSAAMAQGLLPVWARTAGAASPTSAVPTGTTGAGWPGTTPNTGSSGGIGSVGAGAALAGLLKGGTFGNLLGAAGGGLTAAQGIGQGSVSKGAIGGGETGFALGGPIGGAIGAGIGALTSAAVRIGGNNTNRQREAFAKSIIGTTDTNAFDAYLRQHLDPTTAEGLINTAHRVIGKNDTTANQAWMSQVEAALRAGH